LLSLTEFAQHRKELIQAVTNNIVLSDKAGAISLQDVLVSPVTPHDDPKAPASQIVVMGRFSLAEQQGTLHFEVGLFGLQLIDQVIEITASNKLKNRQQVFELSPKSKAAKLTV